LIDTGARRTVITPRAAQRCCLVSVNSTKIFVVGGGEVEGSVYSAQILFSGTPLSSWPAIEIVEADLHHPEIECLIGRDILRHWILEYDGSSGQLIISENE
jgi:predicted aspartyl protease